MGNFGFAVVCEVDGAVRPALDDGWSGSRQTELELPAGVGPIGLTSSLDGRRSGARIMESEAGLTGPQKAWEPLDSQRGARQGSAAG